VGAIGGVIVLLLGLLLTTAGGVPLRAVAAAAIAVGLFLAAGWLLLSMLLDTFAGEAPGRRRTWWTVGVTALAMLAPFFLLSAFVDTSGAA
jgi:hypothetical protein